MTPFLHQHGILKIGLTIELSSDLLPYESWPIFTMKSILVDIECLEDQAIQRIPLQTILDFVVPKILIKNRVILIPL